VANYLEFELKSDITRLLRRLREGDTTAHDQLFTRVYEELRRSARRAMEGERPSHTLQATALVHEAFLRLANDNTIEWQDRKHFFVIAAQTMRRILVDHARRRYAAKRDGGPQAALIPDVRVSVENADDILAVDQALVHLEQVDSRKSQVVELRYFAGLSINEVASILDVDSRTVKRDWQFARAWLHSRLAD
jgi:RNA polymerase sigma factor (TIGR02999 family)